MSDRSKETRPACPEFALRAETFNGYFDNPLPRSTFHDLVNKGKIIPMKGILPAQRIAETNGAARGSRTAELREAELGGYRAIRVLADRPRRFPGPQWLLDVEIIPLKNIDHAQRVAETYRDSVEAMDEITLKLAYFNGVLDVTHIAERDGK